MRGGGGVEEHGRGTDVTASFEHPVDEFGSIGSSHERILAESLSFGRTTCYCFVRPNERILLMSTVLASTIVAVVGLVVGVIVWQVLAIGRDAARRDTSDGSGVVR
jgi:hypothetical protein